MTPSLSSALHPRSIESSKFCHALKLGISQSKTFILKIFSWHANEKDKMPSSINMSILEENRRKIEILINLDPNRLGGKPAYLKEVRELINQKPHTIPMANIMLRARKQVLDDIITIAKTHDDLGFIKKILQGWN